MHDLSNAFFDAFRNDDFAFPGQQLHGAHFTHIHTYWVGRAAGFAFHRCQGGSGFFSSVFVCAIGIFSQQQLIGFRRHFVYRNAHVVNHTNDIFDLIRIGDVSGKVVVHFRVGQETLFLSLSN